jgi:hypothetical protein
MTHFSGSYPSEDVVFLLKPVSIETTDVEEKERRIQSGECHYSEMLSEEKTPDDRYMQLFHEALVLNAERFALDIARLALTLAARPNEEVVLVSLARAGTPVGVLLHRALSYLGRQSAHYSVSIIRDRGLDQEALRHIIARHNGRDIVFVDGWTGKGAICTELTATVSDFNHAHSTAVEPYLVVVSDLAGVASLAASSDDYLIPSAILNSIISGLVSRTVLNDLYVGPGDFHACAFYEDKRKQDLSVMFVDTIGYRMRPLLRLCRPVQWGDSVRAGLKRTSDGFIASSMERWQVFDRNRIKPGIGESTRALLRRVPDRLVLRERGAVDIKHLEVLADTHNVPVEVDSLLPYRAAVVIKTLGE